MIKKRMLLPTLYIVAMGISNAVVFYGFKAEYGKPEYIKMMLPFLAVIAVATVMAFFTQKNQLKITWEGQKRYILFLVMFIPTLAMAIFYWVVNGSFESSFLVPLAVTLAVGIAEEMMFRRILFAGLLKETNFKQSLIISAIIFSLLHSVNILAGMPFQQMLIQLVMTFLAGLYYILMFHYTKNIYLMIASHWLWDYLLLGGAVLQFPLIGVALTVMNFLQILIVVFLFNTKEYQNILKA